MKQKKYSESKINRAQKFLSKYELSFDDLDESQKKIVINYTGVQKLYWLCFLVLASSLILWSFLAYTEYQTADSGIDQISKVQISATESSLLFYYGKVCFKWGLTFGLYSCFAFLMLVYIILTWVGLRAKFQLLDAFLPSLKQSFGDDKFSNN